MIAEFVAYILALFVGVTLGLVGAGGSILTLPILVKVVGIEPKHATTYSLFIVGFTAFIGAISYYRKDSLHLKTAAIFSIPCVKTSSANSLAVFEMPFLIVCFVACLDTPNIKFHKNLKIEPIPAS